MSAARYERIKRYGKMLFNCEKAQEILLIIPQELKAIDAKLKDKNFKFYFEKLLRALVEERFSLISYNNNHVTALPILNAFKKLSSLINQFPTIGRKLLSSAIDLFNTTANKEIREECDQLITTMITECQMISIPKASNENKPKFIKRISLQELLQQFLYARNQILKIESKAVDEACAQLSSKIAKSNISTSLMKLSQKYDATLEFKYDNDLLFDRNPFNQIFRDCLSRLKKDENNISKATKELVCSFREIVLALEKGKMREAIIYTLAAIEINGASSLNAKKRADLLDNLVKYFIPAECRSFDLLCCFYELANYFEECFDSFQRFLRHNPREEQFYDLMTAQPTITLPRQAFFGLHYAAKGAWDMLHSDPEAPRLPGDSPSPVG